MNPLAAPADLLPFADEAGAADGSPAAIRNPRKQSTETPCLHSSPGLPGYKK